MAVAGGKCLELAVPPFPAASSPLLLARPPLEPQQLEPFRSPFTQLSLSTREQPKALGAKPRQP